MDRCGRRIGVRNAHCPDRQGGRGGFLPADPGSHPVELTGAEPHSWLLERKHVRTAREKANADYARDLMSSPAVTIASDYSIVVAAKLMDAERVKRLPVVDADGRLAGIVSRADLLRPFLRSDDDIRDEIRVGVVLSTMLMDPQRVAVTVDLGVVTMRG